MKRSSQKIGLKKITLSNLSTEALEGLKGGSSYVTYNCPTNSCNCPIYTDLCIYSDACTAGCNGESVRFLCFQQYEP